MCAVRKNMWRTEKISSYDVSKKALCTAIWEEEWKMHFKKEMKVCFYPAMSLNAAFLKENLPLVQPQTLIIFPLN